ncbi:hypothetical protein ASG67_00055 [Sphingomonas sp. Leaf339]|nr:hypothetical protein ASG67_00055 [Sphingomonas sp. Leaf339]
MSPVAPSKRELPVVALILVVIAVAARARTFGNPVIGFDEQFYLLVGDRMWHGMLPFVDIFDRKPIGLFLIYALAAGSGSKAILACKLLALASVLATALLIFGLARRANGPVGALAGAALYILWLDFMEGEGVQAPVFDNLAMVAAAAMVLVGIALQIKYSVLVEGIYLGCLLIVLTWQAGIRGARLAGYVMTWIGGALLPTALAFGLYTANAHAGDFVIANFLSVLGQERAGGAAEGTAVIASILAPLFVLLLKHKTWVRGGNLLHGRRGGTGERIAADRTRRWRSRRSVRHGAGAAIPCSRCGRSGQRNHRFSGGSVVTGTNSRHCRRAGYQRHGRSFRASFRLIYRAAAARVSMAA